MKNHGSAKLNAITVNVLDITLIGCRLLSILIMVILFNFCCRVFLTF